MEHVRVPIYSSSQVPSSDFFDLVVGMDWLQQFSPMKVDWANKWMCISYRGTTVCLQGLLSSFPAGAVIELRLIALEEQSTTPSPADKQAIDPQLQAILSQFEEVFSDPMGLPPSCHCDHAIPLVQGAHPFAVRPYRYRTHQLSKTRSRSRCQTCCPKG